MKVVRFALAFTCLFVLALPAFGQQADDAITRGIPGYLDPNTGAFKVMPVMPSAGGEANPDAVTTSGGKIVTAFTINVQSAIASTAKIACSVQAVVLDIGSANTIIETATVAATRSGTTAKCTVTIPYSWTLTTATTDKVNLSYSIVAPVEASATTTLPSRTSSQGMGQIAVPANGAITNKAVTAAI